MTIDQCKNSNESRIIKLQVKSYNGQYEDLDNTKSYKVLQYGPSSPPPKYVIDFIEQYHFRSTFYGIDILKLQSIKHFIF